jgi:GTP-binding protein HflX
VLSRDDDDDPHFSVRLPPDMPADFLAFIRDLETNLVAATSQRPRRVAGHPRDGPHGPPGRGPELSAREQELRELCRTAGIHLVDLATQRRPAPDPRTFFGQGKLRDVLVRALEQDVELLICDPDLSPSQAREIGERTDLKVIDRTTLILDIFAQHATSADGKLQVELAQLRYLLPRMIGHGTAMSRLAGGIGGRGPGETKLEIDPPPRQGAHPRPRAPPEGAQAAPRSSDAPCAAAPACPWSPSSATPTPARAACSTPSPTAP